MRIRKRFLHSSIASDPQVPVQFQDPQSCTENPRLIVYSKEELDEIQDEEKNNHIIRKNSNLVLDSSNQQVVERLLEEEKVIPPKKRIVMEEPNGDEKDKRMKGKMNKKSVTPSSNKSGKMRGSEIMDGSRCSRVNGRGWRCGQQTLIGYSLCEHHLGKGRLRSTSSGAMAKKSRPVTPMKSEPNREQEMIMDDEYDDDGDDDGVVMVKKKMVGMVKARSIRSLLGEADGAHHVLRDSDDDRST